MLVNLFQRLNILNETGIIFIIVINNILARVSQYNWNQAWNTSIHAFNKSCAKGYSFHLHVSNLSERRPLWEQMGNVLNCKTTDKRLAGVRSEVNLKNPLHRSDETHIKPDTPINVYTWFCLNTAKSKFSLVSPVADWWNTINKQLNWIVY